MTEKSNGMVKRHLHNGLTVLHREDHSNPVVAIKMWFHVGSVNETDPENGLRHFQDHMVSKGTERHGVVEIADLCNPVTMPYDLAIAHEVLNRAVDAAFGKKSFTSEMERVSYLFSRYLIIGYT